jgi:hypothetical protein
LIVGALRSVLDIEMNAGDLVSRQVRLEDIHALLGSPQRGSVTDFGNNERRAATREAWRMPAHLNIGPVKRASLCDHRDVEIANDPKLLGRSQRRARDSTIDALDPHSNDSRYFLEDHVSAIKTGTANCVLVRQDKRSANVRMARKRHLSARRENAHASGTHGIVRRQDKRCLSKVELVRDGLHLSVRKVARIGDHRDRVATELPVGEDVDRLKWHLHNRCFPQSIADQSPNTSSVF